MNSASAKKEIESVLAKRFGSVFQRYEKQVVEVIPTGIWEVDGRLEGLPRGAITEIHGTASSGRISLLLSALAVATAQEETCALVDTSDTFDLLSAANARVDCDRLLWIRCNGRVERAFKATDLLLQSGGFGLVALNLADVEAKYTRRIITSWWFRFRRAIESTPTALIVVTPEPCIRSCATLVLEIKNEGAVWPNSRSLVWDGNDATLTIRKDQAALRSNLSLITELVPRPPNSYSLPPAHSQLLQGSRVRVNQERPTSLTGGSARFRPRLH
jgi:hypothetical protein